MGKSLVIVESPAKARTISRYLGKGFEVESSIGHVRDLPGTAAEIPAKYKQEPWSRLGVDVDHEFHPLYIVPKDKQPQVKKLKAALSKAEELYLATDEDREGEAIAWHLQEVLRPKVPVRRMVFHEITRNAITKAIEDTREIDRRLVDAQETRRVLDRLYGYELSPVLWKKVRPRLSAGRVQSVATRLVVERERARMRFRSSEYWDLRGLFSAQGKEPSFEAKLLEVDGRRVAGSRDFEESTGQLREGADVRHLVEASAQALCRDLEHAAFNVADVQEKAFTRRPYAPFITSTLQQEASRKLRFGAQRTMRIAQRLYENGYITYMRTDSTQLSEQAISAARGLIGSLFGAQYLPEEPRTYARAAKGAQEAHEAIRPAGDTFRKPEELRDELDDDALKLYELIWKRTVACQMKDAEGLSTTVRIEGAGREHRAAFSASGRVLRFPGFLRAYVEGSDDPQAELEDRESLLPPLAQGEIVVAGEIEAQPHTTQPPARFTEASLVKELEERGIGRPSTYATILQTIQDRGYVWKKGMALVPTFTAFAVTRLLEEHMGGLVDFGFTARMEDALDAIARGDLESLPYLTLFYFGDGGEDGAEPGLQGLVGSGWEGIDAREISSLVLGTTPEGEAVAVRVGRYGPYLQVGDSDRRATLRDDIAPDELTLEHALELLAKADLGDQALGTDPETGLPVYVKTGRFGDYVQLGDPLLDDKGKVKKGSKPKMASLWPDMSREELTLEQALMLLSFPREVGRHPETGEVITVQDGRFGPYVKMGSETRSLQEHSQLASIDLEGALALLREPKGRSRRQPATLREIGAHPESGEKIELRSGRYGPYVTDGAINASVPKGKDAAALSLEEAVELLAARAEKLRAQGKSVPKAAPAAAGKTPAKKAAKARKKGTSRKASS